MAQQKKLHGVEVFIARKTPQACRDEVVQQTVKAVAAKRATCAFNPEGYELPARPSEVRVQASSNECDIPGK